MRIDVVFGPGVAAPALVSGRAVAIIDVLRASTTIAAALHNGARFVVPLETADEVDHALQGVGPLRGDPRRRAEDAAH